MLDRPQWSGISQSKILWPELAMATRQLADSLAEHLAADRGLQQHIADSATRFFRERGDLQPTPPLKSEQIETIRARHRAGESYAKLGREYGKSKTYICLICTGKKAKAVARKIQAEGVSC